MLFNDIILASNNMGSLSLMVSTEESHEQPWGSG